MVKAIHQARFLWGRYRSGNLENHWSSIREGICIKASETTNHILISCIAYYETKKKLYSLWLSTRNSIVYQLVLVALSSDKHCLPQFSLDYFVFALVIRAAQHHGYIIYEELVLWSINKEWEVWVDGIFNEYLLKIINGYCPEK